MADFAATKIVARRRQTLVHSQASGTEGLRLVDLSAKCGRQIALIAPFRLQSQVLASEALEIARGLSLMATVPIQRLVDEMHFAQKGDLDEEIHSLAGLPDRRVPPGRLVVDTPPDYRDALHHRRPVVNR